MEITILGPVRVVSDDGPVSVGGLRQRTLLGLLSAVGESGISIFRLVEEIWAGSPPYGAEPTVRTYITRLRKIIDADPLEPSLITGGRDGYRLDTTRVGVDRVRFERLVSDGQRQSDPRRRARILEQALAVWQGPAFSDTSPGALLLAEATRLDQLRLSAAEQMARAELDCGRHREVIPALERLVNDQPWHEGLWSLLVLALYRAKRQAEALRTLQSFRDRLRQELGLEPSRDLLALEHDILVQESALDWRPSLEGGPAISVRSISEEVSQRSLTRPQHASQSLESGRRALAQGSYSQAVDRFARGLAVLDSSQGLFERQLACDLLLGTAEAHLLDRNLEAARNAAFAAADVARRMGSAARLGQAAVWATYVNTVGRVDPLAAGLCEEALEALGESEPALRARVLAGVADYQGFGLGEGRDAIVTSRQALRLAQDSGDDVAIGRCLFVHAEALGWSESAAERLLLAEPLLRLGRRTGDRRLEADGLHVRALARLALGDLQGFDADRANLERTAEGTGYWYAEIFLPLWRAMRYMMEGQLEAVEPLVHELLARATDEPNIQNLAAGQLFFIKWEQGELNQLLPVLTQITTSEPGVPAFVAGLALACVETGDTGEATRMLEAVTADGLEGVARDLTWTTTLCLWTEVAVALGHRHAAGVLLRHLGGYSRQVAVLAKGIACLGSFDRYLGMLHGLTGDEEAARESFEVALQIDRRLRSTPLLARTQLEYGRFLARSGSAADRELGWQLLAEAGSAVDHQGRGYAIRAARAAVSTR
ncbi:MAG: AfsR/SARP family transcriptional regulator [Acidobacteriota bacterium]|nr:AfsR/SARP family transcriptional regulator [Acidobacteriota bacterium]